MGSCKFSKHVKIGPKMHLMNGDNSMGMNMSIIDLSKKEESDKLGDVLHWLRQATALLCGVVWGVIPLTGAIWLLFFLVLSTGVVFGYYSLILKVDEEEFGGHGSLLQEGLFASVTLFLLAWILVYSLIHF
ncbi:unnamed protein product [Sphagnum tenellum]